MGASGERGRLRKSRERDCGDCVARRTQFGDGAALLPQIPHFVSEYSTIYIFTSY